ncbi:hypothetical protein [Erythrobacter colymbi]|uniref:hypothetical protein n=1 Tax=Erythrobacter colymbi TaxID=1161202 RepID=UPI00139047F6|nr:hypothetical protein [Erythrobacter colymbi]
MAAFVVAGCAEAPATIPEGCYVLDNGEPLLEVGQGRIRLLVAGNLENAAIGPWLDPARERFAVTPAFYLRDGTVSGPAGPSVMAQSDDAGREGSLTYRTAEGRDVLLVPVEAYGFREAVREEGCGPSSPSDRTSPAIIRR